MNKPYKVTFVTSAQSDVIPRVTDLARDFGGSVSRNTVRNQVGAARHGEYRFATKTSAELFLTQLNRRARVWQISDREITSLR